MEEQREHERINLKPRVLLVEDEPNLAFNLKFNLSEEGFEVVHESRGDTALHLIKGQEFSFNLAVLDVMLPSVDGFELARNIRELDPLVPIIMLTARTSEEDRLFGLGLKVDDYISKPFHLGEFLLKAKRAVERSVLQKREKNGDFVENRPLQSLNIVLSDLVLDTESQTLTISGDSQQLTEIETKIIKELMTSNGKILSREYLLKAVWGRRGSQETRTVDAFMVRIRRLFAKVKNAPAHEWIRSIRGRGYLLVAPDNKKELPSILQQKPKD